MVAIAIGVVVVLAIAACGGSSTEQSEPASTEQAKSEESAPASGSNPEANSRGARALAQLRASILQFGKKATKAEAAAAGQTMSAYLIDRESKFWDAACSYLTAGMRSRTQQIGGKGAAGCGRGVEALTTTATTAEGESTIVALKGLRRSGNRAFLLYTTEAGITNAMVMIFQKGNWHIDGVNPTPLFSN